MGRNNARNIKKHNDKLHKAQGKVKQSEIARKDKLKAIAKKFNVNINVEIK
jgi:LysM repeat protein